MYIFIFILYIIHINVFKYICLYIYSIHLYLIYLNIYYIWLITLILKRITGEYSGYVYIQYIFIIYLYIYNQCQFIPKTILLNIRLPMERE